MGSYQGQVAEAIRGLGLRVAIQYSDKLSRVLRNHAPPNWHPCPCPSSEEMTVAKRHLENLAERGESLLNPIVTASLYGNRFILAPMCIIEAALSDGRQDMLERVKAEVWDLGDLSGSPSLAKAVAALLCIAYFGRRTSEVKLEFVKDYLMYRVLELARRSVNDALKFIEQIRQRIGVDDIVDELVGLTSLSRRSMYDYLAEALDDEFIEDLRSLVLNHGDVDSTIKSLMGARTDPVAAQLIISKITGLLKTEDDEERVELMSELRELTILGKGLLSKLAEVVSRDGDAAKALIHEVRRLLRSGEPVEAALAVTRKYNELIEGEANGQAQSRGEPQPRLVETGQHAMESQPTVEEPQPMQDQPRPPVRAREETTEEASGEAIPTGNAEQPVMFRPEFKFECIEGDCDYITYVRELSRASLNGDTRAMLNAALALASKLAEASNKGLAEALNALGRVSDKALEALSELVRLAMEDPSLFGILEEFFNAYMGRDPQSLCITFNDLMGELIKRLPSNVRDMLSNRAGQLYINCERYPGRDELLGIT